MKNKSLGHVLLAVYLILISVTTLAHVSLGAIWILIPALAGISGVLLLIGR